MQARQPITIALITDTNENQKRFVDSASVCHTHFADPYAFFINKSFVVYTNFFVKAKEAKYKMNNADAVIYFNLHIEKINNL
jgi:hypothetical protein